MEGKLNIKRLRAEMQRCGLKSISTLAEQAGLHRNSLAPYLSGEKSLYSRSALALATALKVSPQQLMLPTEGDDPWAVFPVLEVLQREFDPRNRDLAYFLFGSRANGRSKDFSDYDIGLTGGAHSVGSDLFLEIKERLSGMVDDLPVKVDFINFDQAPIWFLSEFKSALRFLNGNPESYYTLVGRIHGIKETIESGRVAA